jgi:hypothetical protein
MYAVPTYSPIIYRVRAKRALLFLIRYPYHVKTERVLYSPGKMARAGP